MPTKDLYLQKEKFIKTIRHFFDTNGFHEIISSVLNTTIPAETNIHPFTTVWKTIDGQQQMYLSASPERSLKLALAQGIGNCYSIGHSFRNLEQEGPRHTPEFLMLEWYRENANYKEIMIDVQHLVQTLTGKKLSWDTISFQELFPRHVGVSLQSIIDDGAMFSLAKAHGYSTEQASWHDLFDQIFLNEIEPKLPNTPVFLVDFPARISQLCKPQKEIPYLAERFEVYIHGIEIGNGNSENTDSASIRQYFQENAHIPVDEEFLSALRSMHGKNYAGIGIGIERLQQVIT